MGILDLFRPSAIVDTAGLLSGGSTGIASPWANSSRLATVVWTDLLGSELVPVSRGEAMSVPAIARARNKVCGRASRLPLVRLAGDDLVDEQPAWLTSSSAGATAHSRMVWTLDDLIFEGWSAWAVQRDDEHEVDDPAGIVNAARIPFEWWEWDQDRPGILVNGTPAQDHAVIVIPGPHEGVLNFASRTIRGSRKLEELWVERAQNPVPVGELHQTDQVEMNDDEIDDLLDDWSDAVKQRGGAFGYTPHNIELKVHGEASAELLVEGRNAAAIDAARVVGVPASLIDASNVNSSLTYETLQGRNLEFAEDLALYLDAIAARLSMDDVAPAGERTAFDTSALTGPWSPTGPSLKD